MNVVWLGPTGMWSLGWLEQIFDGHEWYQNFEIDGGAYVVVAAEYMFDQVEQINAELAKLPWSVVILASDERGLFPVEELSRDIDALWVMTPHFEKHNYPEGTHFMGEGCPQEAHDLIGKAVRGQDRLYTVGFSGQITHERRQELAEAMREGRERGEHYYLNETAGFTQGLTRPEYYQLLVDTQATPAPSGPETLDSFRAFETLEAGGVPILDLICPVPQDGHQYWDAVLGGDHPLPSVYNWNQVHAWGAEIEERWPAMSNQVFSWWQLTKRRVRYEILSASPVWVADDHITVLMPTSPVPSNPDLAKITTTIESVRHHLPTADILILCDGVRPEQEDRREAYNRFVTDLLWKANFEWTNVYPIVSPDFRHQCGTARDALAHHVTTDLVMYVEHDIPLTTDLPIDFEGIERLLASNDLNVVRFAFENQVHPDWEYLMLDPEPVELHGVRIRRTRQWSQRVHVTRAAFYRQILEDYFPLDARTMIEDRLHSVAKHDPAKFRMAFYHPLGNIMRCYHIDGRETDLKYDMDYGSIS